MPDIPITKPYFTEKEKELVQKPLETGWVVQGEYVEQFEKKMTEYSEADYAVATTSCTTALHLAVKQLGISEGDEVICPAYTWVSTPNVVEYEQGTPVFCDVNPDSYNLDTASLRQNITTDTVGILPVHLFGLCANMPEIMDIARQNDLWVVEDAACALGGRINGQHAGTFGDAGCFSFHPRKSITTGEGGIVTTNNTEIDQAIRSLRDHGATKTDLERHEEKGGFLLSDYPRLGHNYRMTDLQGAVGCAQFEKVNKILQERRKQAERYDQMLESPDWIHPPEVPEGYQHGYQAYVCVFKPEQPSLQNLDELNRKRNQLMKSLEEKGIATRPGTHSAAHQTYYRDKYGIEPQDYPQSYMLEKLTVTLPMYVGLTSEDQERVVETMCQSFSELWD